MGKMARQRCPTIGVILGNMNPYTDLIRFGISERAKAEGVSVFAFGGQKLSNDPQEKATDNVIYHLANQYNIDGVIVLASEVGQFIPHQELTDFTHQFFPLPVVSIGENIEDVPSILIENRTGFKDRIDHLLDEHGYRKIAFVTGPTHSSEAQIRKLNQELEQHVRERTAELEVANRELEAFAYAVAHNLQAPLRAVDGYSQVLIDEYTGKFDAVGEEYLRRSHKASQRMAGLIDDLLGLSRVTRETIQYQKVNLSAIAGEVMAKLHKAAPERVVQQNIMPEILVTGDERLLRLALGNLFDNAWKFTLLNEVTQIEFGQMECDGEITYYLRDNGSGFDMAYANKLFDPFQRLHSTEEFDGTGIGLAIVERIIRRHGGHIWAQADVGSGATFSFTLGNEIHGNLPKKEER